MKSEHFQDGIMKAREKMQQMLDQKTAQYMAKKEEVSWYDAQSVWHIKRRTFVLAANIALNERVQVSTTDLVIFSVKGIIIVLLC